MICVARTYTVKPTWTTLQFFVSYRDTECYAAGNTAMEEMDEAVEIVSLLALMATVPFASMDMFPLAQSLAIGAMTLLAGRNPSGSLPIVALPHDELIVTLTKRQLTITMPAVLK